MKHIIMLMIIMLPSVLAFNGSSESYQLEADVTMLGFNSTSANYELSTAGDFQPVGNMTSDSYELCIGWPFCFPIQPVPYIPKVIEQMRAGAATGAYLQPEEDEECPVGYSKVLINTTQGMVAYCFPDEMVSQICDKGTKPFKIKGIIWCVTEQDLQRLDNRSTLTKVILLSLAIPSLFIYLIEIRRKRKNKEREKKDVNKLP